MASPLATPQTTEKGPGVGESQKDASSRNSKNGDKCPQLQSQGTADLSRTFEFRRIKHQLGSQSSLSHDGMFPKPPQTSEWSNRQGSRENSGRM